MGGVVLDEVAWTEEYSLASHGWFQAFRLEVRKFDPFLYMTTNVVAKNPPEPWLDKLGSWEGLRFSENELCYILAEIERPLKPAWRFLWVWPIYLPTIRALYPEGDDRHPGVCIVLPNPEEQKHIYNVFNRAYVALAQL